MRKCIAALFLVSTILAIPAFADLQNVQVGGSIVITGNYWFNLHDSGSNNLKFVEQRTHLTVAADFTENVSAFIDVDDYSVWGEDFRSNYLTGVDSRGAAYADNPVLGPNTNPSVFQAYIEAKQIGDTGLRARIGRQKIELGSGWLLGASEDGNFYYGYSYDALRLTYAAEQFSVDAIAAKLAENSPVSEDGDQDLYILYGSYLGIKDITLDAYWMFLRDAASTGIVGSRDMHTFGLRGAGKVGALDFESEVANQVTEYKDHTLDSWGANLEVGYTFDAPWSPRPFIGGAYFDGEDKSDGRAAFIRPFSGTEYSMFLDAANVDLSNAYVGRAGVSVLPCDKVKLQLNGAYFGVVQTTKGASDQAAWELGLSATYAYTNDLSFRAGYSHLFALDGLEKGTAKIVGNGTAIPSLPPIADDADYLYFMTTLKF